MSLTLLLATGMFFLSLSISPGPVNLTIVTSGANHSPRQTPPFVTGATPGFVLLLAFVGFWLTRTIEAYPRFFDYLGMVGAAFIVHVGHRIVTADPRLALEENGVPGFFQDVPLQWFNPRTWIACASGVALFASPSTYAPLLVFMAIYSVVCYLSLAAWAPFGDRVALLLDSPRRVCLFNRAMSGTLVLIAGYMLCLQLAVSSG